MKPIVRMSAVLIAAAIIVSGCWSHYELTDLAFVMGVAIDTRQDGTVQITAQYYKPKGGKDSNQNRGNSNLNVVSTGNTVLTAIRNITGELGRRSQWSHMRIVLVSEETARRTNLGDLLDVFYRDPEPRLTAAIVITSGSAQSYLEKTPTLEQTTSQQIMRSEQALFRYAARTVNSNLLKLGKQLQDKTKNAVIAYVTPDGEKGFKVSGSALIKKDRMVDKLTGDEHNGYLMLADRFNYGLVELPCADSGSPGFRNEVFEIHDFSSHLAYRFDHDRLVVSVKASASGSVKEMKCSAFNTVDDELAFKKKAEKVIEEEMKRAFAALQNRKADILQLGDRVYQNNPSLWFKLQPEWDSYFSRARLEPHVTLKIEDTGTSMGKPVFK